MAVGEDWAACATALQDAESMAEYSRLAYQSAADLAKLRVVATHANGPPVVIATTLRTRPAVNATFTALSRRKLGMRTTLPGMAECMTQI
ncbi:hypothetical protein KEM52_003902 [Ascosphaera acerosa]|nr:hypothetical protein KEM52_003902 [Ascosphaera acerosa]